MKNYTSHCDIFLRLSNTLTQVIALALSLTIYSAEASEKYKHLEKVFNSVELKTIDKQTFKISEEKAPVTILNFWASWCLPCLEEIPSIVNLRNKISAQDLNIILINTDENDQMKNIDKIKKKYNIPSTIMIVADKNFQIADQFKFSSIPVSVFYNKKQVLYFSDGPVKFDSLEIIEKIKSVLKK